MRAVARCLGLLLIVVALVFLGVDLVSSLEMHGILVAGTVGGAWDAWGGDSTALGGAGAEVRAVLAWVFGLYAWVLPGVTGIGLMFAGCCPWSGRD